MFGSRSRFRLSCAGPAEESGFGLDCLSTKAIVSGFRTGGELHRTGSTGPTLTGNCQNPGSTTSLIERLTAMARSTLFSPIVSRRSARGRVRKRRGTNASALAWGPTTATAMTEAGLRSPTLSLLAGASASWPVVYSRLDRDEGQIRRLRHWATNELLDGAIEKDAFDVMPCAFDKTARDHRQLPD